MPRRQAVTAADWAAAEKSNVRVFPTGGAELAVKNLLCNPGLLELDDDGNPVWWDTLIGPTSPNGWHVYAKGPGGASYRQTIYGPNPLSQTLYTQSSIALKRDYTPLYRNSTIGCTNTL